MLKTVITYTLLAWISYRIAFTIKELDLHKTAYKHHPGRCRAIKSLTEGSENMERIPGDKALVTTGLRFQSRHIKAFDTRQSKVFLIDLNNPDDEPKFVTIHNYPGNHSDLDFHGLSSWVDDQTGEVFVFLVNHLLTKSVVEIFQYIEDEVSLNHIRTCEDDSFHLLNDVVAVDKQSFYVTNYLYWRGSVASKIEMFLMLKWGSVLFYDGEKSRVVRDGLFMTNGINKSPDNRYIYVAVVGFKEIMVFRTNKDRSLTLVQTWPTYTLHDNAVVDENGDIWIAGHSVCYKILMYLEDPKVISPSQVLRLKTKDGLITDMTEPFADDGKLISGSSVALYVKNKLFIGSIYSQTVVCDVEYI